MARQPQSKKLVFLPKLSYISLIAGLGFAPNAWAIKYGNEALGLSMAMENTLSVGAAWRTEDRDENLLGKLNVPGQENLCAADDCLSLSSTNTPGPNARFVAAKGFYSPNGDDGNLNYDKYDMVSANVKLTSDYKFSWGRFSANARTIAFFDEANVDRKQRHPNQVIGSPATAGASTPRGVVFDEDSKEVRRLIGTSFDVLDAYVGVLIPVGKEKDISLKVGKQGLNWGESTFLVSYSLNSINPPSLPRLRLPGQDVKEVFQPVDMIIASMEIVQGVSVEGFYQYGFTPVEPDPVGSFFSTSDLAGAGGRFAAISFGKTPEDPNRLFRGVGAAGMLSTSSRTLLRDYDEEERRAPKEGGQYGASLKYFADWLNGGTEFGFYYMNIHSRLPLASFIAANETCIPPPMAGGVPDPATATDCDLNSTHASNNGREALPVDTARTFLEFPEDIKIAGISFNTTVGDTAVQGEYAHRFNTPLQVSTADLTFAALQPAFPVENVNLGAITVPGRRVAVPDYVSGYRGETIQANQYIRGYERMDVGQFGMTLTQTIGGANMFNADQIILIGEFGATAVYDMPDLDQLQFNGPGTDTHYGCAADGTGPRLAGSCGNVDSLRQNPTAQTDGFATDFSWGYRLITLLRYQDAFLGFNIEPLFGLFHDVKGYSPGPGGNFIEGRKQVLAGMRFEFRDNWAGEMRYTAITGGREHNQERDRDNFAFNVRYSF